MPLIKNELAASLIMFSLTPRPLLLGMGLNYFVASTCGYICHILAKVCVDTYGTHGWCTLCVHLTGVWVLLSISSLIMCPCLWFVHVRCWFTTRLVEEALTIRSTTNVLNRDTVFLPSGYDGLC